MSIDRRPTKDARRDAAREKARAMREAVARKQRQRRVLGISLALVAAVVVVGLIALAVTRSNAPAAAPDVATKSYGISTGTAGAPHTVAIYEDYQCPVCKQFTTDAGAWLEQQRDAGTLKIEYRPISFLDQSSSGNRYSTRAANAAWCVASGSTDGFSAYNDAMYAQQPAETSNGRSDSTLWSVAKKAGAGAGVEECIKDGTYEDYVKDATTHAFDVEKVSGTPTVYVDGTLVPTAASTAPTLADVQKALGITS